MPDLGGKLNLAVKSGDTTCPTSQSPNETKPLQLVAGSATGFTGVAGGSKHFVSAVWGLVGKQNKRYDPNEVPDGIESWPPD